MTKTIKSLWPFWRALVAVICLAAVAPLNAQQPADSLFTRAEAMIPMRDGARLYTQVFAPTRTGERFPILLIRTPYGTGQLTSASLAAAIPELTADGYIFVFQDIRGRFKSEGEFVMLRQPRDPQDKKAIDEGADTYDTIEWLLKNTPTHNGRVGMAGTSYGAWLTVMGMLDPHPALKAAVPQASPADMWIGDDFHHNGAGWWDQEDFYGPLKIYELLERHDSANQNFLVVGPWNHGGWSRGEGRKLGPIDFGSATAEHYRRNVLARFLAYHLKGKGSPDLPEALTFRTGANEWLRHDAWPPKRNVVERRLYFQADGKLSFDPPRATAENAFDSYVSDPANPVPYRPRPISLDSGWETWLVADQRFAHHRPDVLTWTSDPLKDDVVVSGNRPIRVTYRDAGG